MHFYIARELLPALALFTVAFVLLGLMIVGLLIIWSTGKQVVRKLIALDAHPQLTRKERIAEVRWS